MCRLSYFLNINRAETLLAVDGAIPDVLLAEKVRDKRLHPASVKSVVGSLPGTSEEDRTGMCSRALKNSRYFVRTSLMFIQKDGLHIRFTQQQIQRTMRIP